MAEEQGFAGFETTEEIVMWIYMNNAFLSVVADFRVEGNLLVRSRAREDLLAAFPEAVPVHTPEGDYPWRVSLPAPRVAARIATRVHGIKYSNFKDSILIPQDTSSMEYMLQRARHRAALDVWTTARKWFALFR